MWDKWFFLQGSVSVCGVHADQIGDLQAGFLRERLKEIGCFGLLPRNPCAEIVISGFHDAVLIPFGNHIHLADFFFQCHLFQQCFHAFFHGTAGIHIYGCVYFFKVLASG